MPVLPGIEQKANERGGTIVETAIIVAAIYFAIPTLGILISGRKLSALGWLVMLIAWPVGWLIFGPEELP